jgi:DNA-binding FadR family transcriptional regulator
MVFVARSDFTVKTDLSGGKDLSTQIAAALRDAIIDGRLLVDERLPSEAELAESFNVSRPTVREALKRLAAQSLIRTQRGASGGAFVNRLSYDEAVSQQITTATLLLSMNEVDFDTACEARFALERACARQSAARRSGDHLAAMRAEIHRQSQTGLSDEGFCASDVAFHRALVDGAGNPVLSWHLAGAVEGMQPLMNMITFSARDRARIVALHEAIADALEARDGAGVEAQLDALCSETRRLAGHVRAARARRQDAPA